MEVEMEIAEDEVDESELKEDAQVLDVSNVPVREHDGNDVILLDLSSNLMVTLAHDDHPKAQEHNVVRIKEEASSESMETRNTIEMASVPMLIKEENMLEIKMEVMEDLRSEVTDVGESKTLDTAITHEMEFPEEVAMVNALHQCQLSCAVGKIMSKEERILRVPYGFEGLDEPARKRRRGSGQDGNVNGVSAFTEGVCEDDEEQKNQDNKICPPPIPARERAGRRTVIKRRRDFEPEVQSIHGALQKNDLFPVGSYCQFQLDSIQGGLMDNHRESGRVQCSRVLQFIDHFRKRSENHSECAIEVDLLGMDDFRRLSGYMSNEFLMYVLRGLDTGLMSKEDCFREVFRASLHLKNALKGRFDESLNFDTVYSTYMGNGICGAIDLVMQELKFSLEKQNTLMAYIKLIFLAATSMALRSFTKVEVQVSELICSIDEYRETLKTCATVKNAQEERFEKIFYELSGIKPKFDELSVSGTRFVKNFMEPPYFKTSDGLMAFEIFISESSCFKVNSMKWTSKDLQALRSVIKEVVTNKKLHVLKCRFMQLRYESEKLRAIELQKEGQNVENVFTGPVIRKRGRPTKEEIERRNKYGIVNASFLLTEFPKGVLWYYVSKLNGKRLSELKESEERKLRAMSFEALMMLPGTLELVDWDDVSQKLMIRTRKYRSGEDCRLAFNHELSPEVNTKRWSKLEHDTLIKLYQKHGNQWELVSKKLREAVPVISKTSLRKGLPPLYRTAYHCFYRFRQKANPVPKIEFTMQMDLKITELVKQYGANWKKIAACFDDERITKRIVIERYKKSVFPLLRVGPFTRIEDCLLLLAIEKMKPFLSKEGNFLPLLHELPWRHETTWRDRATNLFSDWIVPWTLEEDQKLMKFAETYNRNWQKIAEQFTSFKNRKGCLTRYKILKKQVGPKAKFATLDEYHEAYSMTRYNVFQYPHLFDILKILTKVRDAKVDPNLYPFTGLMNDQPPHEELLQHMLLVYDKKILSQTMDSLNKYIDSRKQYWNNWIKMYGSRKKTFDRRTWHEDNPQSVASAIHIRGLKLKDRSTVEELNPFEQEVYQHFARFNRTKPLKADAERRYIPPALFIIKHSAAKNIIATTESSLKETVNDAEYRKWYSRFLRDCKEKLKQMRKLKSNTKKNAKTQKRDSKEKLKEMRKLKSKAKKNSETQKRDSKEKLKEMRKLKSNAKKNSETKKRDSKEKVKQMRKLKPNAKKNVKTQKRDSNEKLKQMRKLKSNAKKNSKTQKTSSKSGKACETSVTIKSKIGSKKTNKTKPPTNKKKPAMET